MRKRRSLWTVFFTVILAVFSFLLLDLARTSGQQSFPESNRRPACSCFCGGGTFASFSLFSKEDISAGKCWGGPLPADVCGRTLSGMPPNQKTAICEQIRASGSISCPAVKAACNNPGDKTPKPECQKPAPWFDPPSDCKDVQAPVVAINNRAVTVSVCGYPVFRGAPVPPVSEIVLTAYKTLITTEVQSSVGSKVCCDTLRNAARTGSPCFPAADIDCDGVPNSRDTRREDWGVSPDINLFTRARGAAIDDFPYGLDPDDPNFMPGSTARESKDVGDCPCKWELASGKLACSPDGQKDHVYTATWKCPANGKEVFTTKYAKASAPCEANRRARNVNLLFEYLASHATSSGELMPAIARSAGCG
jgi:hypothetical protein